MAFGKTLGVACASFAVTNIDDLFVLVTFVTEAATSPTLTPARIFIGQYLGFTIIMTFSLIGWGVAFVIPTEPIGFLGLVPIMLGVWKATGFFAPSDEPEDSKDALGFKSILKVASVTLANGADNIGTYIPLFSQARRSDVAIYVVTYYVLLGVWCLAAFLVIKQRHILHIAERYSGYFIPLLYIGLGTYIVVQSECFPWTIGQIDAHISTHPGKLIMGIVTSVVLSFIIGIMVWFRLRQRRFFASHSPAEHSESSGAGDTEMVEDSRREASVT